MTTTTYLDDLMDWAADQGCKVIWAEKDAGHVVTVVNFRARGQLLYTHPYPTREEAAEAMFNHLTKED